MAIIHDLRGDVEVDVSDEGATIVLVPGSSHPAARRANELLAHGIPRAPRSPERRTS